MAFLGVFLVAFVTLLSVIYLYVKNNYGYWRKRGVLYLEPSFPFGNIRGFNRIMHSSQRIGKLYDQLKSKGSVASSATPFAGIYLFHRPVVLAIDLDFIKTTLIRDFNNFRDRGMYFNERDDPLTGNLFAIDGPKWRQLRTKLTPTFTSSKMKFMFPTIVKVGKQLEIALRELMKQGGGGADVEIKDILTRFTTDVIGTCAFGIECNSLKDPNAEFRLMGKKVFDNPRSGIFKRIFLTTCKDLAKKLRMKRFHDDVTAFFMKVVRETIDLRKEQGIRRNDFMDLLIQLMDHGKLRDDPDSVVGKITLEQLAAQAFVFFLAGFETSSAVMTFTLYELAQNQNIQEKARKSIETVLKRHDGQLKYESIMEMTYIHQVINESLRKYPPSGNLFRVATENYNVPDTDKTIEKGTMMIVPVYGIHHDPDYYPDPDVFDPDRFGPDSTRNPGAFLPFGEGPRNCIGLRFGLMQARVGIATLLKHFKFSTCEKTTIPLLFATSNVVLSPKGGLYLRVEPV